MPAPPPRFARAHALLAPLLAKTPEDKELLLVDGVACVALGQDALAAKELDAVATVDSMRGSLRGLLGKHGFPEWKALADGLAAKPEDGELRKKRAELLDSVHAAPPLVARDYEAALRAKPDDVELKKSLARAYRAANHYEKAIPLFKELPDADEIHAECAVCLIAVSRFAEAKEEIAKIKDPHKLPPQIGSEFLSLSTQVDKLVPLWEDEKKFREADAKKDDNPKLQLETEKGKIVLELFEDTAPNTVANIISLSETGYYNGVKFHRIIAGFMAQGGDPQGTGMGGPGYTIKDELKGNPRFHWRGTLSMAHAGPNTGGSQFFLCYSPTPHLNEKHTVFGRIIEGQEVADELERGDEIVKATVLRKRDHEYKVETHAAQRPPMRLPPGSVHPH
jgi:peptidyl-prolyl cis-trans isomerase B (cyclophilin B)